MAKTKHRRKRTYAEIINPIHHLERTVEKLDSENDRLQRWVILLSIMSVMLATVSIFLVVFYKS